MRRMTGQIPIVDLEAALSERPPDGLLDAVREAAERVGAIQVVNRVEEYLEEYGRPDQIAAWREGRAYVAQLSQDSAGR
jgi:hypothetical protein